MSLEKELECLSARYLLEPEMEWKNGRGTVKGYIARADKVLKGYRRKTLQ